MALREHAGFPGDETGQIRLPLPLDALDDELPFVKQVLCHGFRANEVRLLLGVIADNLCNLLGRLILPPAIQSWSLTTAQQRLFKTGRGLIRHARFFVLRPAEGHLTPHLT